jgi:HNH endonuclease
MPEVSAALRAQVRSRAAGRCEYCKVPETVTALQHEVDHIIATKHGGETGSANLALCCTLCNRYKGTDLASIDPESGDIERLFHPRRHPWHDHFRLQGGTILPLTAVGRVTIRLLQLNRAERVLERELMI